MTLAEASTRLTLGCAWLTVRLEAGTRVCGRRRPWRGGVVNLKMVLAHQALAALVKGIVQVEGLQFGVVVENLANLVLDVLLQGIHERVHWVSHCFGERTHQSNVYLSIFQTCYFACLNICQTCYFGYINKKIHLSLLEREVLRGALHNIVKHRPTTHPKNTRPRRALHNILIISPLCLLAT